MERTSRAISPDVVVSRRNVIRGIVADDGTKASYPVFFQSRISSGRRGFGHVLQRQPGGCTRPYTTTRQAIPSQRS